MSLITIKNIHIHLPAREPSLGADLVKAALAETSDPDQQKERSEAKYGGSVYTTELSPALAALPAGAIASVPRGKNEGGA